MKLYAIRHGQTEWNHARLLQGQKGSDLDEEGILLAEMTADALKDVHFDLCYTSPLIRARHTAEIIMKYCPDSPIIDEQRIQEISFGVWEGKSVKPGQMEIPLERYRSFHQNPNHYIPPEGGETIADVVRRCRDFYQELIHNPELQDKTILISTHGCAIRGFMNNVYDNKEDYWHGGVPMNCAVSIIEVENGKSTLVQEDKVYYPEKYYHSFFKASTMGKNG